MKNKSHKFDKATGRRRLRKNISQRYEIEKSPLYGLRSIHRLAALLNVQVDSLDQICSKPSYHEFDEQPKPNAKPGKEARHIQEPIGATLRVHYRLLKFFDSIERPDFLHSATKKRSYVSNAMAHKDSEGAVVVMDIRRFYENTTYEQVKQFFLRDLKCALDLSRYLASVCTINGHLPTGSCISPLLSYFVHRRMFAEIEETCSVGDVVMTLYVDDLTLSGSGATKTMMYKIKSIVRRRGLKTHTGKDAVLQPGKPAIITGVICHQGGIRLRNKHHDAIVTTQDSIAAGDISGVEKLRGQMAAARVVDPTASNRLDARLARVFAKTQSSGSDAHFLG